MTTDAAGVTTQTLTPNTYRFRTTNNGIRFFSSPTDKCTVPTPCTSATILVNRPITVTVRNTNNNPISGLTVAYMQGAAATNIAGTTDAAGQIQTTRASGSYRFRTTYNTVLFYSDTTDAARQVSGTRASGRWVTPQPVGHASPAYLPAPIVSASRLEQPSTSAAAWQTVPLTPQRPVHVLPLRSLCRRRVSATCRTSRSALLSGQLDTGESDDRYPNKFRS